MVIINIYIYIYIYTHTHIHIYTHTHTYIQGTLLNMKDIVISVEMRDMQSMINMS